MERWNKGLKLEALNMVQPDDRFPGLDVLYFGVEVSGYASGSVCASVRAVRRMVGTSQRIAVQLAGRRGRNLIRRVDEVPGLRTAVVKSARNFWSNLGGK